MHANATTPILLLRCGVMLTANAHAQSLPTVDDFATGPATVTLTGGDSTTMQTGSHILGGGRLTQLVFSTNPFHQITEMRIRKGNSPAAPSAFVFSEGFNLAAIDQRNFFFQAAGDAVDTGLTEIEFVPLSASPGDVTC